MRVTCIQHNSSISGILVALLFRSQRPAFPVVLMPSYLDGGWRDVDASDLHLNRQTPPILRRSQDPLTCTTFTYSRRRRSTLSRSFDSGLSLPKSRDATSPLGQTIGVSQIAVVRCLND